MWKTTRTSEIRKIQEFFRIPTLKESDGPGEFKLLPSKVLLWTILWQSFNFASLIRSPILGFQSSEQLKNELEGKRISGIEFRPLGNPDEESYGPKWSPEQFITNAKSSSELSLGCGFLSKTTRNTNETTILPSWKNGLNLRKIFN